MGLVPVKEVGGKVVVVVGAGVGETSCGSGVKGLRSSGSLRKVLTLWERV